MALFLGTNNLGLVYVTHHLIFAYSKYDQMATTNDVGNYLFIELLFKSRDKKYKHGVNMLQFVYAHCNYEIVHTSLQTDCVSVQFCFTCCKWTNCNMFSFCSNPSVDWTRFYFNYSSKKRSIKWRACRRHKSGRLNIVQSCKVAPVIVVKSSTISFYSGGRWDRGSAMADGMGTLLDVHGWWVHWLECVRRV